MKLPSWGRHGRPLVIAHRGASAVALENTLPAFEQAVKLGAHGVELDAMRCASGEVVVFHDDTLERLGGGPDKIYELPLAAIRQVLLRGGATIPTLDEVVETLGPRMLINIELKTPQLRGAPDRTGQTLALAVASICRRHSLGERALVSSFNPAALFRFRLAAPDVPRGLLFASDQTRPLREAWSLPVMRAQAVHPEKVLCTAASVAAWRRAGYLVHVWTVDERSELVRLAGLGVDALICNDVAHARAVLEG